MPNSVRITEGGLGKQAQDFLKWWRSSLIRCVPGWARRLLAVDDARVLLAISDTGGLLKYLDSAGELKEQKEIVHPEELASLKGVIQRWGKPLTIIVPDSWVLKREINLPAAAKKNIGQVLAYEMDRFTPFNSDQVYFAHHGITEESVVAIVRTEIAVVRRNLLDRWLDVLLKMQVEVDSITADCLWNEADLSKEAANLAPLQVKRKSYLQWLVALLAAVLLAGALLTPLMQKRADTIRLIGEVNKMKRTSESVMQIKERTDAVQSGMDDLIRLRQSKTPVVAVLNQITQLLPDDTWVQQLSIQKEKIELRGESAQATKLIKLLEDSPNFTGASFRSPVVQARGKERYHVAARLMVSGATQ